VSYWVAYYCTKKYCSTLTDLAEIATCPLLGVERLKSV